MYCKNCGELIDDNAYVCPKCGVLTNNELKKQSTDVSVILGIIAICIGIFIPIVAWVCGGIGLSQANKINSKSGKILNIIGLILGSITFLNNLYLFIFVL